MLLMAINIFSLLFPYVPINGLPQDGGVGGWGGATPQGHPTTSFGRLAFSESKQFPRKFVES